MILEERGDSGSIGNNRYQIHVGPIPPVTMHMVPGQEDVEIGPDKEGGTVPDR